MNVSAQSASLSLRGSFFTASQSMSEKRFQRLERSACSKNVMYSRWNLSFSARERAMGSGRLLRHQPVHELREVAEGLDGREVLIRHADGELLFEVADQLHHGDGVEAELRDDGLVGEAGQLLAAD